jgi:hypothetical protein
MIIMVESGGIWLVVAITNSGSVQNQFRIDIPRSTRNQSVLGGIKGEKIFKVHMEEVVVEEGEVGLH